MEEKVMRIRKLTGLGTLIAIMVAGSVAFAQEQSEASPAELSIGQGAADQKTDQKKMKMGGCPMMKRMMGKDKGGMMGQMMGLDKSALFGTRVTPVMNLSVEDVSGYLSVQLDQLNNKRLKLGEVKSEDRTITADIVTVDNSLVQRLKVNRHTGLIEYQN
jgi:hypothetical protein